MYLQNYKFSPKFVLPNLTSPVPAIDETDNSTVANHLIHSINHGVYRLVYLP